MARFEYYEQCPRCVARGKDSRDSLGSMYCPFYRDVSGEIRENTYCKRLFPMV
jgi:hypothetical protein